MRVLAKDGDAEAYRLLTHGMQDSSVIVRIAAVQSLAIFKGRDTTPALIRAGRDADPEVREATVVALATRGGERVEKTLLYVAFDRSSVTKEHELVARSRFSRIPNLQRYRPIVMRIG